ncbi:MAG: hypothetical protein F9K24_18695 [Leptonema illini]|uniref:Uncharacterized protein n=1 Tax=Leptonema illini TaxID=183 RepID=A0A833GYJ9_9LEPT|nr:MAG: hypothetical protein F9K24_18695 [Leptonema illini]
MRIKKHDETVEGPLRLSKRKRKTSAFSQFGLRICGILLLLSIPVSWAGLLSGPIIIKYEIEEGNLPSYLETPELSRLKGSPEYTNLLKEERRFLELRQYILAFWTPLAITGWWLVGVLRKRFQSMENSGSQ